MVIKNQLIMNDQYIIDDDDNENIPIIVGNEHLFIEFRVYLVKKEVRAVNFSRAVHCCNYITDEEVESGNNRTEVCTPSAVRTTILGGHRASPLQTRPPCGL